MSEYVCPQHIQGLFMDDRKRGRQAAVEWAADLILRDGDLVWLPEIGWTEYNSDEEDGA